MRQQRRLIKFNVPAAALTALLLGKRIAVMMTDPWWMEGQTPNTPHPLPEDARVVAVLQSGTSTLMGDCTVYCESEAFPVCHEGSEPYTAWAEFSPEVEPPTCGACISYQPENNNRGLCLKNRLKGDDGSGKFRKVGFYWLLETRDDGGCDGFKAKEG